MREVCRLAAAIAALICFSPLWGGAAPASLRLEKTPSDVVLTWTAGTAPYGVYRSTGAAAVVRSVNVIGTTQGTSLADSLFGPGELQFYQVADPPPCIDSTDCDDADSCTVDRCDPTFGCQHEVDPASGLGVATQLAGVSLSQYPFFDYVRAFNEDRAVQVAIDPTRFPDVVGKTCDVYVVEARSAAAWCADAGLVDARGAPDTRAFVGATIEGNVFPAIAPFALSADAGAGLGVGYDVVLDCDRDGRLGPTDFVDGSSDESGLYLVHDLTLPGALGTNGFDDVGPEPDWCEFIPLGGIDDLRVFYPDDLDDTAFVGTFPLVVISHGNGHCYDWYDFLGEHLASYGYIVLAHDNETVPGIEAASTTTLEFTDRLLAEQGTLGAGVLLGHIDSTRITWIGHSRGGEGVVRAYDRLRDEGYSPPNGTYTVDDIALISSIAPTDWLGPTESNPHEIPYHLLYGSADGDVCGCPWAETAQSFNLFERGAGYRQATYVQGADHNDFNCCGFDDFAGPPATEIGRDEAQRVAKAVYVALLEHYVEGNIPAKDFLWRQYESLRPIGVAETTIVGNEYRDGPDGQGFVVDDFQTEASEFVSSSGTPVSFDVLDLVEGQLNDGDGEFTWDLSDPMNGMTRARLEDTTRGVVFEHVGSRSYATEVAAGQRDMNGFAYLSMRLCQGTRHPYTAAALGDMTLAVTLVDGSGGESSINIGAYGGGIEEPYQREGEGPGVGWQNEFETIRIRLTDFMNNGSALDFQDVVAIRLELGPAAGALQGRLGLDDIELTLD